MKDQMNSIKGAVQPQVATVSRKELLINRSDSTFRRTIHTLMAVANNVDTLKVGFGALIGITGPQHELMMLISRVNEGEGIGVGEVAKLIRKSSAFVAMETNQLQKKKLIEKVASLEDKRRVVLRVTAYGQERLKDLAPSQREVNNALFGDFDREEFLAFIASIEKLLPCSERACEVVQAMVREQARQKLHRTAKV